MKFVYADGEKLCYYEDGKTQTFESNYILNYRETVKRSAQNKKWKTEGKLAREFDDGYYFDRNSESVEASIRALALTEKENELIYAVTVNESSGVYKKAIDREDKTEAHVVSSSESEFQSLTKNNLGGMLAAVQNSPVTANIAVFEKDGGDYKCVTGGDSLDENPSYSTDGKSVYFNSYGVGRDANNNFIQYMPSEIYKLDLSSLDVETVVSNEKFSYIKPIPDGKGNLYCIKKPGTEKTGGNPLLEILMIPVRLVQACAGCISAFVMCFSGKPLVSGQSASEMGDVSKGKNVDKKKVFINNNLISVDEQLKKNKKQDDYGFIPSSWKLVLLSPSGEEKELASGVADYCLTKVNADMVPVFTNGKHIFSLQEGKKKKLVDTDFCLRVGGTPTEQTEDTDFFGML